MIANGPKYANFDPLVMIRYR